MPPHPGPLGRSGSIASLTPDGVKLLALKPAEDGRGLIVRVQEIAGRTVKPRLTLAGRTYALHALAPHTLATYRIHRSRATAIILTEL